jgi:hypothetical protein
MSDILHNISILANLASIVLALIGLFFVIQNWRIWKKLGMDIIKAKAFLNKRFLERNWLIVVIVGGLIMSRRLYRFFELTSKDIILSPIMETIFDVIGFLVILILVFMAYQWYKLIHDHN